MNYKSNNNVVYSCKYHGKMMEPEKEARIKALKEELLQLDPEDPTGYARWKEILEEILCLDPQPWIKEIDKEEAWKDFEENYLRKA